MIRCIAMLVGQCVLGFWRICWKGSVLAFAGALLGAAVAALAVAVVSSSLLLLSVLGTEASLPSGQ